MSHNLSDKAAERLNYIYDLIRRYQPALDSYTELGHVTPEMLEPYNNYLKEYHTIIHTLWAGINQDSEEIKAQLDEMKPKPEAKPDVEQDITQLLKMAKWYCHSELNNYPPYEAAIKALDDMRTMDGAVRFADVLENLAGLSETITYLVAVIKAKKDANVARPKPLIDKKKRREVEENYARIVQETPKYDGTPATRNKHRDDDHCDRQEAQLIVFLQEHPEHAEGVVTGPSFPDQRPVTRMPISTWDAYEEWCEKRRATVKATMTLLPSKVTA